MTRPLRLLTLASCVTVSLMIGACASTGEDDTASPAPAAEASAAAPTSTESASSTDGTSTDSAATEGNAGADSSTPPPGTSGTP